MNSPLGISSTSYRIVLVVWVIESVDLWIESQSGARYSHVCLQCNPSLSIGYLLFFVYLGLSASRYPNVFVLIIILHHLINARRYFVGISWGCFHLSSGTNFCEILIEIPIFSFIKMHLKISPGKWRPFCLGLNVLNNRWNMILPTVTSKGGAQIISTLLREYWGVGDNYHGRKLLRNIRSSSHQGHELLQLLTAKRLLRFISQDVPRHHCKLGMGFSTIIGHSFHNFTHTKRKKAWNIPCSLFWQLL